MICVRATIPGCYWSASGHAGQTPVERKAERERGEGEKEGRVGGKEGEKEWRKEKEEREEKEKEGRKRRKEEVTVTCTPCCSGSTTAQFPYLSQYLYTGGEELAGRGEPSSGGINKT